MPGLDGTGPWGQGPLTGGRRGYCAGAVPQPWQGRGGGRGLGLGRGAGGGRGWRNQYYATGLTGWQRQARAFGPSADAEQATADQAAVDSLARLEGSITQILERLERLETAVTK